MLQASQGKLVSEEFLRSITDVGSMPRTLATYYIGQSEDTVLDIEDADLLIIDNYAEMNFSMWAPVGGGSLFWMHPKYVRDSEWFYANHVELGRPTLEKALEDAVNFITLLRKKAPALPVLVLNQQVDYYPKLQERAAEFHKFGARLAQKIPLVFPGAVLSKEQLDLADLNSSGDGNTLHFQAATYLRMLHEAEQLGLADAVASRRMRKSMPAMAKGLLDEDYRPSPDSLFSTFPEETMPSKATIDLDLDYHPASFCPEPCSRIIGGVEKTFANYFLFEGGEQQPARFTPMLIDLKEFETAADWFTTRPATYRHQIKKSQTAGFFVAPFHMRNHSLDVFEINTSKETRSGGAIRSNLTKSLEELGGLPVIETKLGALKCSRHWRQTFGVFEPIPGYVQGELVTDRRLLAYISVVRYGELAVFAQILGHGDYLEFGVVNFLIGDFIERAMTEPWGRGSGLRYLMYGGAQNGGEGLFNFKRRTGFVPSVVSLKRQSGFPLQG